VRISWLEPICRKAIQTRSSWPFADSWECYRPDKESRFFKARPQHHESSYSQARPTTSCVENEVVIDVYTRARALTHVEALGGQGLPGTAFDLNEYAMFSPLVGFAEKHTCDLCPEFSRQIDCERRFAK
jgi:hypothetical protein